MERQYIAIDLKSFYASVECVERGLDPLDTCLVVADESRTPKTICLAVSPALKAFGTGGRPRLFEVIQKVNAANAYRGNRGKSWSAKELKENLDLQIDFVVAPPRMQHYIDYSSKIYDIYLRFVAPEDIHVYSIDEVFIDVTQYKDVYKSSSHDLAMRIIQSVLRETGITATAGIGTNLYLAKIAMDIKAKKMMPDKDGVRIGELDEISYRKEMWDHLPLTDFWRIGPGVAKTLFKNGVYTMGDIARCSLQNQDLLYNLFGVNAELIIDHAWGWEPVTLMDIKSYRPDTKSISSGQVLQEPYTYEKARVVILEMADAVAFELLEKGLKTNQIVLTIGYDVESLINDQISATYTGKIKKDRYGRKVPDHSHGTINIEIHTSLSSLLMEKTIKLFDRIINKNLLVRRLTLSLNNLQEEKALINQPKQLELDLFSDPLAENKMNEKNESNSKKERDRQEALLKLRQKYGKNVVVRGLNFADGATQIERNSQIGGHKA